MKLFIQIHTHKYQCRHQRGSDVAINGATKPPIMVATGWSAIVWHYHPKQEV